MSENNTIKCTKCNKEFEKWHDDKDIKQLEDAAKSGMCKQCYIDSIVFALKEDDKVEEKKEEDVPKFRCGTEFGGCPACGMG